MDSCGELGNSGKRIWHNRANFGTGAEAKTFDERGKRKCRAKESDHPVMQHDDKIVRRRASISLDDPLDGRMSKSQWRVSRHWREVGRRLIGIACRRSLHGRGRQVRYDWATMIAALKTSAVGPRFVFSH